MSLVDRLATAMATRVPRRSFLNRAALVGSAVAVGKGVQLVLEPGTAYARVCGCNGQSCDCGSRCCTGYTDFCCTVNGGSNFCPPNTVVGGWWKADTSSFCGGGPRYYMDCNATCACSDGGHFCSPACDGVTCGCANGDCGSWRTGCVQFRYGQCNQDVDPIGRIVCRMVTCVPPWEIDPTCTTASATDNNTAEHNVPCWDPTPCRTPATRCAVVGMDATATGQGYALATSFGKVFTYGDAVHAGDLDGQPLQQPIVGLAMAKAGGYWMVARDGGVFSFGGARFLGSLGALRLNQPIVGMAPTPSGLGYWLVASDGGIFCFGDARFFGSLGAIALNQPVVGMARTPSGRGYWLVARDGGVFTFGDARFHGAATGSVTAPVVGIAARPLGPPPVEGSASTATEAGYWVVARDGGVFSFAPARFAGAGGGTDVAGRTVGLVADADGDGYWIVSEEGAVVARNAADVGSPLEDVR